MFRESKKKKYILSAVVVKLMHFAFTVCIRLFIYIICETVLSRVTESDAPMRCFVFYRINLHEKKKQKLLVVSKGLVNHPSLTLFFYNLVV